MAARAGLVPGKATTMDLQKRLANRRMWVVKHVLEPLQKNAAPRTHCQMGRPQGRAERFFASVGENPQQARRHLGRTQVDAAGQCLITLRLLAAGHPTSREVHRRKQRQ
jgi:hypothetical protein